VGSRDFGYFGIAAILVLSALILVVGIVVTVKWSAPMSRDSIPEIERIARSYVVTNKHWNDAEYEIAVTPGNTGDLAEVVVTHVADLQATDLGGGKSFVLVIDIRKKTVERVFVFQ
jgi:hypothetical protein